MKLFVTDEELIALLGLPKVKGFRILAAVTKQNVRAPFPRRDPLFADRRYLPAVLQWFDDYFGVRAEKRENAASWEEHFDQPSAVKHSLEQLSAAKQSRQSR